MAIHKKVNNTIIFVSGQVILVWNDFILCLLGITFLYFLTFLLTEGDLYCFLKKTCQLPKSCLLMLASALNVHL